MKEAQWTIDSMIQEQGLSNSQQLENTTSEEEKDDYRFLHGLVFRHLLFKNPDHSKWTLGLKYHPPVHVSILIDQDCLLLLPPACSESDSCQCNPYKKKTVEFDMKDQWNRKMIMIQWENSVHIPILRVQDWTLLIRRPFEAHRRSLLFVVVIPPQENHSVIKNHMTNCDTLKTRRRIHPIFWIPSRKHQRRSPNPKIQFNHPPQQAFPK